jgi:hypothetical protein
MTRYTPLWEQAGSYAASVDRHLISSIWPQPASTGCAVTAQAGTMNLNVAAGAVAVPSQNNTGSTLCVSDAVEPVVVGAAPGAGLNRIDLVICQPRGTDLDGGTNNDLIFTTVPGTPLASPTPPATPAGSVALAQVFVGGNVAAITQANITDVRPALLNPAAEPATTSASIVSRLDVSGDVWVAKAGVNGGLWKRARDVLAARVYRNAAFSAPATEGGPVGFDTVSYDAYSLVNAGTFTAPLPGLYRVAGVMAATATASGQNYYTRIMVSGIARYVSQGWAAGAGGIFAPFSDLLNCPAGGTISLNHRASPALAGFPGENNCNLSVSYQGTG